MNREGMFRGSLRLVHLCVPLFLTSKYIMALSLCVHVFAFFFFSPLLFCFSFSFYFLEIILLSDLTHPGSKNKQ